MTSPCPSSCLKCKSYAICLECAPGFFLRSDQLCYSSCPSRFFPDSIDKVCVACPYDCLTCDANGNCLTCNSTSDFRSLSNSSFRCLPLVGFYDPFALAALPCINNCQECKSDTICINCKPNFYFLNHSCLLTCPSRYYLNTQLGVCIACPYDCYTCLSDGSCTSCLPSDNRVMTNSSRCSSVQGFYDAKVTASAACPLGCSLCESDLVCTQCLSGFFLIPNGLCFSTCPPRFIKNTNNILCETCPYDCLSCDFTGLCLSCDPADFR